MTMLPGPIERNPALDQWLAINTNGTITICTGKAEIGQGIRTAIAMIAAEELNVSTERIRVQTADTERTPNEFITAGSMSVEDSGSAVRIASATARQVLLTLAAEALKVSESSLAIMDGTLTSTDSNEQTDYWLLQAGQPFDVQMIEMPVLKNPHDYGIVGHGQTRLDLDNKVRGQIAFVHDMALPGMRYGRLVKPPTPGAVLVSAPVQLERPGIDIVRNGSFLAVIADREEHAAAAALQLSTLARWDKQSLLPLPEGIPSFLRANVSASLPVIDGRPSDESCPAPAVPDDAARTIQASYYRPYQMHGAMGPSAAVAQFMHGRLTVYSHSQGVEILKQALAHALPLVADQIHVIHAEGSGCYGHNGADDVALDAAILAIAAEPRPVKVQWTRADEHGHEPYGPATLIDMQASLDSDGRIIDWRHQSFGFSHAGRPRPTPGYSNLESSWWCEPPMEPAPREPAMFAEAGIHRNMQPIYDFSSTHLMKHFVSGSPLRTSSLRSLGAFANVFAIESFMDELAAASDQNPFEFRFAHLQDERAAAVLETLRSRAPASRSSKAGNGRGIALARYKNRQTWCAVMVDLHVRDDASICLDHVIISADAGLVIDPDGLINQLEGGFIQAASWTLKEEVLWDADGVTTLDWATYPIIKFSEIPTIETFLIERPLERALGAGEASTGPTPAAIANAVFAATGLRLRDLPITPERLRRRAAS